MSLLLDHQCLFRGNTNTPCGWGNILYFIQYLPSILQYNKDILSSLAVGENVILP